MRWSQVRCFLLGLIAYIYGVSVVLSRTAPTTRTPAESCGLTEFDDVESRVVAASVVVDAIVNDLRRIERTSSSVVLYQAHLTVIRVLKGRLERSGNRPRGLATITVGTFARASRRFGTIKDVDDLCASFGLPVDGSRYIVYLSQPNWSSDVRTSSSSRRLVYNISSSLEPYSANKLNVIQRCSRRRYPLAAKVRIRPRDMTLLTGQRLRIRCRTFGRPEPSVTWYKDGQPLQPSRRVRIKSNRRRSRLQISEVTPHDAGTYRCQAQNVAGPASNMTSNVQIHDRESTTKSHVRLCEDQSYCFNGGTCYVLVSLQRQLCECKASFEGQRCREKRVAADVQPVVAGDDNDDDYDTSGVVCDTEESELSILRRLAALTTLASS